MSDVRVRVASAVIVRNGRILLTQRRPNKDYPWTWECPGGKVDGHETLAEGLARELNEELGVTVGAVPTTEVVAVEVPPRGQGLPVLWDGMFKRGPTSAPYFHLFMLAVDIGEQEPRSAEGQGIGWFTLQEFLFLHLAPGNHAARAVIARHMACKGAFPAPSTPLVEVEVIHGAEGACLTLNSQRVSGPKPWVGGRVLHSFRVPFGEIFRAAVPDSASELEPSTTPVLESEGCHSLGPE